MKIEVTDFPDRAEFKDMFFFISDNVDTSALHCDKLYNWLKCRVNPPKYLPFSVNEYLKFNKDPYVEKIDQQTGKKFYLHARVLASNAKKRDREEILALVSNEEGTVENAVFFDKNGVGCGNSHMRLVLKERR